MKTLSRSLVVAASAALLFAGCATAPSSDQDKQWQSEEVETTIDKFTSRDAGIGNYFADAYGYAVFPAVGKAAVAVGGAYGRGQVFEQGAFLGYAKLEQASIGFSLGGQKFAEVIFFKDKYSLDSFTSGSFEFAAQASAVAVKAGASADADYSNGVVVFTMPLGGAMFEAAVGGQKFKFEKGTM